MTYNQEKKKSKETDSDIADLGDESVKQAIINMFTMFQKAEEIMNIKRRNRRYFLKTQKELLEIKM